MKMTGERFVPATRQKVWEALNDPEVLKACVPGCESVTRTSDSDYAVLMTARVGPVSAKFKGKITLADLNPPTSYKLGFDGQGGVAGFGKGSAAVVLSDTTQNGIVGTTLKYEAEAQVGGKLAQIGSRLIDSAAAKMADDFFARFVQQFPAPPGLSATLSAAPAPGLLGRLLAWLRKLFN